MSRESNLWKHFRRLDNGQAACNHCCTQYKSVNTRAAMLYHVKTKHRSLWHTEHEGSENSRESNPIDVQPSTSDGRQNNSRSDQNPSGNGSSKRKSTSNQKTDEITKRIAAFIAMDMLPISLVEGDGFKMLMEYLAPQYTMASRTTIRTRIQDIHEATKRRIAQDIEDYEAVALTTDAWTSRTTTSFVTVTLHAVSPDWQMKTHTLDSLNMSERHTAENLRDHLGRVISKWKIENKVVAIAHDNASNITAAVRSSSLFGSSVPCFAHTLQCAINVALKVEAIKIVLDNSSDLETHFKHSSIATSGLKNYQRHLNLPEHALIQRCKTRWNSSFYMAQRLTEQRRAVEAVIDDEKYTKRSAVEDLTMPDNEWNLLQDLVIVLQPFEVATRVMSTENYPTLSMVPPLVHQFVNKFMKAVETDNPRIARMKTTLRDELTSRFLGTQIVTASSLACTLDPRYKNVSADNAFGDRVMQEIQDILLKENNPSHPCPSKDTYGREMDYLFDDEELGLSQRLSQTVISQNSMRLSEITEYLGENLISRTEDPLQWWKSRQKKFPALSKIARKYLGIPATSVSSERVFSTAGNIINAKRNCLSPENANMLIFLYQNRGILKEIIRTWN